MSAPSQAAAPGETGTLEEVLVTEQLPLRPSRAPDLAAENRALLALADALTQSPRTMLRRLVDFARELTGAGSAGISILEPGGERGFFRLPAISGAFARNLGAGIERDATPCGAVLDRNQVLLFNRPARSFPALDDFQPPIFEALLAPFSLNQKPVGTLWVFSHEAGRRFEMEDARLLKSLSRFAAAAYAALGTRTAALNLMEDAVAARRETERTHEALRGSEERLRLMLESAHEYAIISMNPERRVTMWNAGAGRLLGYSEAEILGESADVIFTAEDREAGAPLREVQTALAEGRAVDERWHVRKDGSRFWGSGMMMPMRDESGGCVGLIKIFRDNSEVRAAQEALEESREQLWDALQENERARAEVEAASQAKDHFLAVLSHELRTPLTPVFLALSALRRRADLPQGLQPILEMIERNVQLESHFIDDLLDLTRISRGKLELVREPMCLHDAIRRAVEVSTPDLERKKQRLTLALEARDAQLRGDFPRLQQVFWNLLKNASKFSPEGGEIQVRSRDSEPGSILVEVADGGIGMEAQSLETIFNSFEQADASISRRFGGLGLGLAIAKATVEAHDGSLRASSAGLGHGSVFTVVLPLLEGLPASPKEEN